MFIDIDPYEQLKSLITEKILPRLDALGTFSFLYRNKLAEAKSNQIRETFNQSIKEIDNLKNADPYTKAHALFDKIKDNLKLYRPNEKDQEPTLSDKTTSYLMANKLIEKAEAYRNSLDRNAFCR